MNSFEQDLCSRLETIREQSLLRTLRPVNGPQGARIEIAGRDLLNFSSNDYLGLSNHPLVKEAAARAVERHGAGSGASRLICGSLAPHQELEACLADFKGTAAALSFSSGYAAALGTIGALMDKGDVIILDRLSHACLVDGARLSGATMRVFKHNDLENLEKVLKQEADRGAIQKNSKRPRLLVVTESVFSMDGDRAPLAELADLKDRYGAWLMVDEAHATGMHGPHFRGVADELGVSHRIEIQMGTMGKALGSAGGFICGPQALIDVLVNRARSFIFSTAPVPAAAAAARAAVELIRSGQCQENLTRLWQHVTSLRENLSTMAGPALCPILPLHIGEESKAASAGKALLERGIFIPAIRYPSVARGKARLRLTVSAAHSSADIRLLLDNLKSLELAQHI